MKGDNTFDRLRDLDVDVDSFAGDSNLSRELENENVNNLFGGVRKRQHNPFITDTMSEIGDEKEKNAIFNHSLKHGVFNDLRNSPLRERMPQDLQYYDPALEKRLFAKEFKKIPGQGPSNYRSRH